MSKRKSGSASGNQAGAGLLVSVAAMKWQRSVHEALGELELSATQFAMLSGIDALGGDDEPITQTRLARHIGADMMLTSKHVRELEDRSLVKRAAHPTDTRARSLYLTREGNNLLKKAIKATTKVDKDFFTSAGAADKLRRTLAGITGWDV